MKAADLKPIQRLAKGVGSCAKEASVYGACINAKYLEVDRDMCKAEFQAFKQCVMKAVGRKW